MDTNSNGHGGKRSSLNWLLIFPVVALVVPYFYNSVEPTLGGIPFFYWYQIAWVFLTAGLTWFLLHREASRG